MSLDKKVRFEYGKLEKEEVQRIVQEAGFDVVPMKYNQGLFGEYKGPEEGYKTAVESLANKGIKAIYRESKAENEDLSRS